MKKLLIMLFVVLFTSITGVSAKSLQNEPVYLVLKTDEIKLKLDLGNITNSSSKEITERINQFFSKSFPKNAELTCSVSVKGSINVGFGEISIEVTVSGPCSEIKKEGKKIATQLLNEIKSYIGDAFS